MRKEGASHYTKILALLKNLLSCPFLLPFCHFISLSLNTTNSAEQLGRELEKVYSSIFEPIQHLKIMTQEQNHQHFIPVYIISIELEAPNETFSA